MWRDPKMVAWFFAAFFLLFVVRLPFVKLGMVPYFVEFHPGFVLLPILAVCWGPAAAWAALAAGLAGDAILGYWQSVSFFRAVGWMVAALCTQRLFAGYVDPLGRPSAGVASILRFLWLAIPACCAAAVWPAVQAGFLRYYPYCYIVSLAFLNNLIFLLLFGPGLYRLLHHHTQGRVCLWRDRQSMAGAVVAPGRVSRGLIWIGSMGSLVAGLLVSGWLYDAWPWSLYLIGTSTGTWVRVVVAIFLVVLLCGLCGPISWRPHRPAAKPREKPKREKREKTRSFGDLYLPSS